MSIYPRKKDGSKCREIVATKGMNMHHHQCCNKAVKDGYCRVHHPDAVKTRRDEAMRRYDEKLKKSPAVRLNDALDRISGLERELGVARQQRDRLAGALEKAEALAIAWVGYWKHAPQYGNGTSHPNHIKALVEIKEALAAVKGDPS